MPYYDAIYLLYLKWYPSWLDRIRSNEYDLRQVQEDNYSNVYPSSALHSQVYIHLTEYMITTIIPRWYHNQRGIFYYCTQPRHISST